MIQLREATKDDWRFILSIRNEPQVRKSCHDTFVISWEQHKSYMEKLQRKECPQWIIICDGKDVGHIKVVNLELGSMVMDGYRGVEV